ASGARLLVGRSPPHMSALTPPEGTLLRPPRLAIASVASPRPNILRIRQEPGGDRLLSSPKPSEQLRGEPGLSQPAIRSGTPPALDPWRGRRTVTVRGSYLLSPLVFEG